MRNAAWITVAMAGCGGAMPEPGPLDACTLAAAHATCPSCSDGGWTCTYGDAEVTRTSCGDCQARAGLYQALCDAQIPDASADIEAGTLCAAVDCEVWYDGCGDACTPQCLMDRDIPETQCDYACYDPEPPPGACIWVGSGCGWE